MKVKNAFSLIYICLVILLFSQSYACKHKNVDPFTAMNFNPYDGDLSKRIGLYQDATIPNLANSKTGNPSLFIDFSDGINSALKDNIVKSLIDDCYNTLIGKYEALKIKAAFLEGKNKIKNLIQQGSIIVNEIVSDSNILK